MEVVRPFWSGDSVGAACSGCDASVDPGLALLAGESEESRVASG